METMGSVKVFGLPAAMDVARVLVCLFEKDVEFHFIRIDTYKGEHKDPSGQATFKQGKLTLTELPRQWQQGPFRNWWLERALIEQWLLAEAGNFEPPSSELVSHLAFPAPMGMKPEHALIEQNERQLSKVLDVYDKKLEESEYLAGDEFSLADLSHLPNAHYLISKSERGQRLFTTRKNVYR